MQTKMASKALDGNGNVRRHSIWTNNYRLFSGCYTYLLSFCLCCFSFYHGRLFSSGRPYSACTVLTRNYQFVILSPTKKTKKFDLPSKGGVGEGGGNFERGDLLHDIETFRSCLFIPRRNFDI